MSEEEYERRTRMQSYLQTLIMFNPQWSGGEPIDKRKMKPMTYAELTTNESQLVNNNLENCLRNDNIVNGYEGSENNNGTNGDSSGNNEHPVINNVTNGDSSEDTTECPVIITVSESYGLELIAGRDIEPGELILEEPPLILGPVEAEMSSCLACLMPTKDPASICPNCGAPLCSPSCNGTGHKKKECEILTRNKFMSCENDHILNSLYNILTPLRTLLLMAERSDIADVLGVMEANVRKRNMLKNGFANEEKIATALQCMGVDVDAKLVKAICGVYDTNAYTVYIGSSQQDPAQALFPAMAIMNHSCVANTYVKFSNGFMTVRAILPIPKGTALTNNYRHMIYGTRHRRKFLLQSKLFLCKCPRCADPTECGSHTSSLRCQKCPQGLYVPSTDHRNPWICYKCNHAIPAKLADTLVSTCFVACSKVDATDKKLMIDKLNLIQEGLGPQHYLCQELKRLIVASLTSRTLEGRSSVPMGVQTRIIPCNELRNADLWLLLDLSDELLKLAKLIEPGLSGFRGHLLMHQVRAASEILYRRTQSSQETCLSKPKDGNDGGDEAEQKVQNLPQYQIEKQVMLDAGDESVYILKHDPLYDEAKEANKLLKNVLQNYENSTITRD